ncbi:MAG TPA: metalloregulator ArsR/SmtB family transcription factor [Rhodopila sp.]|nr:metalloregulator ArsR/SmtB family transcription factor [Rhodopila sp.]
MSITSAQIAELAEVFRIIGEPSRLSIILACLDGPLSVSDLAACTGLSANLVSHHLRLLRAMRIVRAERRGRRVFYAAADEHVRRMLADMVAHVAEVPDAAFNERRGPSLGPSLADDANRL